jgi:teichuronic acid biosynthesis glycosyltransferase TuaG
MENMLFQQGLVSIITPVFQAERFIEQTILSVLAQSYQNWEMILVDDCSNDRSASIIKEYAEKDKRIKYCRLDKNSGAAVARNKAINSALGEYLAFLDSDDLWVPTKLEKQITFMNNHKYRFSFTRIKIIDSDNNTIKEYVPIPQKADYNYLLKRTVIATSTVVINRSTLPHFNMPLRRGGQDYATSLMLMRNGILCYGLNEVLSHYRVMSKSLSSNKWKSVRQVWEIQTQDEGIYKVSAAFNVCCFIVNAFIKHFLH